MIAASRDHCMLPGCDERIHCRGVCHADYTTAMRMVKAGKTTWEELEKYGIVRPARPMCRVGQTRVAIALEAARTATAS